MNAHERLLLPQTRIRLPARQPLPASRGAGLGTLVHLASSSGDSLDLLHRQLDATRKSVSDLVAENESLKREIDRLNLGLKLERQTKFATNRQRQARAIQNEPSESLSDVEPRKRGAPEGRRKAGRVRYRPTTRLKQHCAGSIGKPRAKAGEVRY